MACRHITFTIQAQLESAGRANEKRQMFRLNVLDGRRLSDDRLVLFKKVRTGSEEVRIATRFSSDEARCDVRNHCVPILDVIVDREDPTISFLVMPFLRYIDDPEFDTVEGILECIGQLLEVGHFALQGRLSAAQTVRAGTCLSARE